MTNFAKKTAAALIVGALGVAAFAPVAMAQDQRYTNQVEQKQKPKFFQYDFTAGAADETNDQS